jgi:hypothetical protein
MPTKFVGKSAEDVARAYHELEQQGGRMSDQYGRMATVVNQWKGVWDRWKPVLERAGYEPERMAQMLEARAQAAEERGDATGAARLQAAADRAWHEISDPREQGEWIDSRATRRDEALQTRLAQMLDAHQKATLRYVNQYGGLSLRAIEKKIKNPKLDINKLLEEATRIAGGKHYDPLDWAERVIGAPEDLETQIQTRLKTERTKWESENRRGLTTHVGAGGGSVPYRSSTLRGPLSAKEPVGPTRTNGDAAAGQASSHERFMRRFEKITPPRE